MPAPKSPDWAYLGLDKPRTKPFSIRLTAEERQWLEARAGRIPVGAFIRDLVLETGAQAPRRKSVNPIQDHAALARVLACLGQSDLAEILAELSQAARIGAMPTVEDVEAKIEQARSAIAAMRKDLVRALGLSEAQDR